MSLKPQAEPLSASDNAGQRILCQTDAAAPLPASHFRNRNAFQDFLDALIVSVTLLGLLPQILWRRLRAVAAKNPLRVIVSRTVSHVRTDWGPGHDIYHEVLECGHPYSIIPILPEAFTAKRRRCAACAALGQSVALPRKPIVTVPACGDASCSGTCPVCDLRRTNVGRMVAMARKAGA